MTTQYTQRDWHILPEYPFHVQVEKYGSDNRIWGCVVSNCDSSEFLTNEEKRTNSQLIAAAPDLLEALENFVSIPKIEQYGFDRELTHARAAIAKARGRDIQIESESNSARRIAERRDLSRITSQTNITTMHREAFNAITSSEFSNFALFSCFVDDKPAAIVAVNRDGDDYLITPLFVSITEKMMLTDHENIPLFVHTTPSLVKELYLCDGLEILPVRDTLWNDEEQGIRPFKAIDDNETWCDEPCNADKAHFWSVYGHLKDGGSTCLDDFATEAEAIAFAKALYCIYPHLTQ